MINININKLILLFALILTGCMGKINFSLLPKEDIVLDIYRNGESAEKCKISADSEAHKQLSNWLSENKNAWRYTPATFTPHILITGSQFTLNFLTGYVILAFDNQQYIHRFVNNNYIFLKCK